MTSTPTDDEILAYVKSAARLQALPLSDAQARRVAVHLARTSGLAALLQATPLANETEPAQLYEPAPFPDIDPTSTAAARAATEPAR